MLQRYGIAALVQRRTSVKPSCLSLHQSFVKLNSEDWHTNREGSPPERAMDCDSWLLDYEKGSPQTKASPVKLVRFGEFEADLQRGELHRNGLRVEIRGQVMDLLRAFLERPGQLIKPHEFRNLLWSDDVHVNFEQSIYTTIKQLRQALGDSASRPRYIETRARRGYRFIAPVDIWWAPASNPLEMHRETRPGGSEFARWLRCWLRVPWVRFLLIGSGLAVGAWLLYALATSLLAR